MHSSLRVFIINQSINQSILPSSLILITKALRHSSLKVFIINQSINQSIHQPINISINQSILHSFLILLTKALSAKGMFNQLINQSINKSIHQSHAHHQFYSPRHSSLKVFIINQSMNKSNK